MGVSRAVAGKYGLPTPPGEMALMPAPPGTPHPHFSITSRRGVPRGTSYTPGRVTHPESVTRTVAHLRKASGPIRKIASTAARVSTLLTTVGRPQRPDSTG